MARGRIFVFLLLAIGVSDRVFGCESFVGLDGATYQLCHSRSEFRAAARAAGVTDLGIETFDRLGTGVYGNGVFFPLYDKPFGSWIGASNSVIGTVAIVSGSGFIPGQGLFMGHALRGQTGFYDLLLGFGSAPRVRALGFDFFDEPVAQYTPTSVILRVGTGFSRVVEFGAATPVFIGIVSTSSFNTAYLQATNYGTMMLDTIEYSGGSSSGPDNPYPPGPCPNEMTGRIWCFDALPHPAWYDPFPTSGYEFRTLTGSFLAIDDFPPGFGDAFTVSVGGTSLGRFSPGTRVAFPAGVTQFRITGITPAVDGDSPTAFPIKLSLDTAGAIFSMRPLTNAEDLDTTAPQVTCEGSDGLWHASDVSVVCTASDGGSGLANAADGSFTLSTSVPAGTETENAQTSQHEVCDSSGNCATAGAVGGNHVDKKPPVVTVSTPAARSYTLGQSIIANYYCTDGGSGVASCEAPVANGTAVQTDVVGTRVFAVSAADTVGNRSQGSTTFTVTYNVCPLFDPTTAKRAGSTVPIHLALCNANGMNVSSPGVQLVATGLKRVSAETATQVEDPGNSNPDDNFRFDDGSYHFNLRTVGLGSGTWELTFKASGDPEPHVIRFQIR